MKHNTFDTLFLDTKHLQDLEIIANKENLLYDGVSSITSIPSRRPSGYREFLFLIMMYEHLDSSISDYSWDTFIEEGIIDENKSCIVNGHGGFRDGIDNEFGCVDQAKQIASFYKEDLLRSIYKRIKDETGYVINDLTFYKDNKKFSLNNDFRIVFDLLINGDFEVDLSQFNHYYSSFFERRIPDITFHEIDPTDYLYNLIDSIYLSEFANVSYASSIFRMSNKQKSIDDIEKVYLTQCKYISDLQIIPMPETFDDVFKFRKDENLISFRKVMNQWVKYVESGEFVLAQKMKSDLIKANCALEHLGKYKRVSNCKFRLSGTPIPI